jgi:hypothetical protein
MELIREKGKQRCGVPTGKKEACRKIWSKTCKHVMFIFSPPKKVWSP